MLPALKTAAYGIVACIVTLGIAACSGVSGGHHGKEGVMTVKPIEQVLREHTGRLMALPGVVGTAQGLCDDSPCIKVYVVKKTRELLAEIPASLDGYRVEVEESGEIRPLP